MQESLRTRKVSELIRQEVNRIILEDVNDPKVRDVVITAVRVTKDLDLAKIYFTTYDKEKLEIIQKGLERSCGFMRGTLVKSLRMKKVPRLEFIIDNSDVEASRIDELLQNLDKN